MNTLKVQVRVHRDNVLKMFWIESDGRIASFDFNTGHNEVCNTYRLNLCHPVSDTVAVAYIKRVQEYYDSIDDDKLHLQLVRRLTNA